MTATTPITDPAVRQALAAVELAGDAARQALRAIEGQDQAAPAGLPLDPADKTLPFPGDATTDELMTAAHALAAQLAAYPGTEADWWRITRLAAYIGDAAGYRAQAHQ